MVATLEGLRRLANQRRRRNPFRVCVLNNHMLFPGLRKRNPGLKFSNAFSVNHLRLACSSAALCNICLLLCCN